MFTLHLSDNLPRLDGAIVLYLIYASFVENVYPYDDYDYWNYESDDFKLKDEESLVVCSKIPNVY